MKIVKTNVCVVAAKTTAQNARQCAKMMDRKEKSFNHSRKIKIAC